MSIRILALSLLAAAAFAQTTTTTSTSTRESDFPPVGFGSSETVEITATNTAANASTGAAASCVGSLSFKNSAGAAIGTAASFTLASGQSVSARVAFAGAASTGTRTAVRGAVSLTTSSATPRPPCALDFSLAVYDTATGATHAVLLGAGLNGTVGGPLR